MHYRLYRIHFLVAFGIFRNIGIGFFTFLMNTMPETLIVFCYRQFGEPYANFFEYVEVLRTEKSMRIGCNQIS